MVTALTEPPLRSADDHCPFEADDLVTWRNMARRAWNPAWRMRIAQVDILTHRRYRLTLEPVPPCPAPRQTHEFTMTRRTVHPSTPRLERVR